MYGPEWHGIYVCVPQIFSMLDSAQVKLLICNLLKKDTKFQMTDLVQYLQAQRTVSDFTDVSVIII